MIHGWIAELLYIVIAFGFGLAIGWYGRMARR
jgi:hypothetical protein